MAASRPYRYGRPTSYGRPATFARPHNGFGRPVTVPSGGVTYVRSKALQGARRSVISITSGEVDYEPIGGSVFREYASITNVQSPAVIDGSFAYLGIYGIVSNTLTATSVFTLMANSSPTALAVSVPGGSTANVVTVSSVDVVQGDLISVRSVGGVSAGQLQPGWMACNFSGLTAHACTHSMLFTGAFAAGNTYYFPPSGGTNVGTAVEATEQIKTLTAGSFVRPTVNITSNTTASATTFVLRVNSIDTGVTITVPAATVGVILGSGSVDVVPDDLLSWCVVVPGSGNISADQIHVGFVGTGPSNMVWSTYVQSVTTTARYFGLLGINNTSTTVEAEMQIAHGFAGVSSKLTVYVGGSTASRTATFRFRKNGASGNQVVSVPPGGAGWYTDASNTDTFDADDLCCTLGSHGGGGSGTYNVYAIGYAETWTSG